MKMSNAVRSAVSAAAEILVLSGWEHGYIFRGQYSNDDIHVPWAPPIWVTSSRVYLSTACRCMFVSELLQRFAASVISSPSTSDDPKRARLYTPRLCAHRRREWVRGEGWQIQKYGLQTLNAATDDARRWRRSAPLTNCGYRDWNSSAIMRPGFDSRTCIIMISITSVLVLPAGQVTKLLLHCCLPNQRLSLHTELLLQTCLSDIRYHDRCIATARRWRFYIMVIWSLGAIVSLCFCRYKKFVHEGQHRKFVTVLLQV